MAFVSDVNDAKQSPVNEALKTHLDGMPESPEKQRLLALHFNPRGLCYGHAMYYLKMADINALKKSQGVGDGGISPSPLLQAYASIARGEKEPVQKAPSSSLGRWSCCLPSPISEVNQNHSVDKVLKGVLKLQSEQSKYLFENRESLLYTVSTIDEYTDILFSNNFPEGTKIVFNIPSHAMAIVVLHTTKGVPFFNVYDPNAGCARNFFTKDNLTEYLKNAVVNVGEDPNSPLFLRSRVSFPTDQPNFDKGILTKCHQERFAGLKKYASYGNLNTQDSLGFTILEQMSIGRDIDAAVFLLTISPKTLEEKADPGSEDVPYFQRVEGRNWNVAADAIEQESPKLLQALLAHPNYLPEYLESNDHGIDTRNALQLALSHPDPEYFSIITAFYQKQPEAEDKLGVAVKLILDEAQKRGDQALIENIHERYRLEGSEPARGMRL